MNSGQPKPEDWERVEVHMMLQVVHRWAGPCPLFFKGKGRVQGSVVLTGEDGRVILHAYNGNSEVHINTGVVYPLKRVENSMNLSGSPISADRTGPGREVKWTGSDPVTCPYCLRTRG